MGAQNPIQVRRTEYKPQRRRLALLQRLLREERSFPRGRCWAMGIKANKQTNGSEQQKTDGRWQAGSLSLEGV